MKTFKLLAALALPAMFAACTSEEIAIESTLQNQEIVGAELVGTDISINVEKGGSVESRYTNGNWESTDLLGLGWIVKGTYTDNQTPGETASSKPNNNTLFANHMFALKDGRFQTQGNVYKGWHFAYFPYERMDKIDAKIVNINPDQDCKWEADGGDRYHEAFAISAKHFLSVEDLENNQLKGEKTFKMEWAANEIAINLISNGTFVTNKYINNLLIQSVELNASSVLSTSAILNAKDIPSACNKDGISIYKSGVTDKVVDENKTKEALLTAIPNILLPNGGWKGKAVTNITAEANLTTGTGGITRIFTLPYTEGKNITPSFKINVEGGYFTIAKVTDPELLKNPLAVANNEQLANLTEAYAAEGAMTKVQGMIGLNLNLYPEIFTPDFTEIDTYNEWKNCVNIVTALGFTDEQTFNITGDIEVNSTTISLPKNCKIKVTGDKDIVIKKTLKSWPAADKLNVEAVDVIFDEDNTISQDIDAQSIVNNATMTIAAGTAETSNYLNVATITNNGTIIVNKYAKVGPAVDNTKGRIEIIYGGIAETSVEGVIYYTVLGTEPAYKLNNLMTEGNVNTFVVNNGITLDVNKTYVSGALDDEYIPTPGSSDPIDVTEFEQVTIELNGGSVIGLKNGVQSNVAEIEVISGETNLITDLKAGLITATAGTLTMDASTYLVGTTLHKYALDMKAATTVDVKAGATLIANANTHVNVLNNAGTVKANAGYLFHYNSGVNTGTLTGEVEKCDCVPPVTPPDFTALEAAVVDTWTILKPYVTDFNDVVTKAQALTDATLGSSKIGAFYTALKDWYEAKGIAFPAYTAFTADYITTYNLLNEGTDIAM